MAFYAKKIKYGADDEVGAYVALIAIAKKKGGSPIKFVLYRFLSVGPKGMFESVEFSGSQEKEAKEAFPSGPIIYRPIEEELEGLQELMKEGHLRRTRINPWKETTDWLSSVAVGGACKVSADGTWVRLRKRPYTWRKSRSRKKRRLRLKFGSLEHKLLIIRKEIFCLKGQVSEKREELDLLHFKYNNEEGEVAWGLLLKKVAVADTLKALEAEVDNLKARESGIVAEMKYVRDKKFPYHATL